MHLFDEDEKIIDYHYHLTPHRASPCLSFRFVVTFGSAKPTLGTIKTIVTVTNFTVGLVLPNVKMRFDINVCFILCDDKEGQTTGYRYHLVSTII